jgi:iron uptake system EfeUOB component EfeO/EfeM
MKDEDPAPRGSADRLPKKGQAAHWKALPGFVKGKVEDILTAAQKVNGKNVKASEEDPRIVLKSDSSGKICVHKPEACYYD